jgi:DNA polymerase-3 subunit alpha
MADPAFIHLRLHTEYSVIDGMQRVDDIAAKALACGMPALAISDLSNVFGWVKFTRAARKNGVKPLFGVDVWIAQDSDAATPPRLLLLVQDEAGYRTLNTWLTRAYRDNLRRGRPEIDPAWMAESGTAGLIALSGGSDGDVVLALLARNPELALARAQAWQRLFPQRYYLELQRYGQPDAEYLIDELLEIGHALAVPAVATHPVQFLDPDDFEAHEARVCVAEGQLLGDRRRPRRFTAEQYFKSPAEMASLFVDLPQALANSVEVGKRCNFALNLGKPQLPQFPTPDGSSLDDYIRTRSHTGLDERLQHLYPDAATRANQEAAYRARLDFELETIIQMGFPGYFLIVADFINWAKHNGVPVGPGRGSGAGSLVAYVLGITDIDPLRYDLLFERFLNPERVSMPDFDIDFCQENRERVIQYVKGRYGAEAVSQIATFGTLGSKSVIRDVGRVLDMPYSYCDKLSKLVPIEGVKPVSLAKALEVEPQLRERYEQEEEVRTLWALASKLEDLTRNVGMHAGGVLIAPGKLTDFCPLYRQEGSDSYVSQYDKDDVEAVGLVKFDFLGLRTLTILEEAVGFVRRHPGREDFQLDALPLDDPAVYALFAAGNTTAVFQSESRSAKDMERKLKADCFEDIIALMALNRPGPLGSGMVDDFIARKQGRQTPEYFHPDLEPVLKSTYGIIVYQEQVMLVAQILAGYSLGAADMLRRAMGKKKAEEMARQREIFLAGARVRGVADNLAGRLFDLMEKFAEYGFNKSHSAAYALIAYQTAWLKAHYAAEFMAATLSSEMADTDKVRIFYEDARANGIAMLAPDINQSGYRFEPVSSTQIRYGLGAIKGAGEGAIAAIVHERTLNGPFAGLFDLCRRVDRRQINRKTLDALIKAGAFDTLQANRAQLLASIGLALDAAEQLSRQAGQDSLFGDSHDLAVDERLVDTPAWGEQEKLLQEKAALGFYFSGHPYSAQRAALSAFISEPLANLSASRESRLMAGIIVGLRIQMGRRGKTAFVLLDDATAQVEVTIYAELLEAHRDWLREDALLIVEGRVSDDAYSGGLRVIADQLYDLTAVRTRYARALQIKINSGIDIERLSRVLTLYRHENGCPLQLSYRGSVAKCRLAAADSWRVRLDDLLLDSLQTLQGVVAVHIDALRFQPVSKSTAPEASRRFH